MENWVLLWRYTSGDAGVDLLIIQYSQESARLMIPQLRVELVVGDEFGVTALLDDFALVENDEPVHRRDGG